MISIRKPTRTPSAKQLAWKQAKQLGATFGLKYIGSTTKDILDAIKPYTITAHQINSLADETPIVITLDSFNNLFSKLKIQSGRKLVARKLDLSGKPKPRMFKIVTQITHGGVELLEGSDPDTDMDDDFDGLLQVEWISASSKAHAEVSFFKHITKVDYSLQDFQVYNSTEAIDDTPCLLFALKQSGVSPELINAITASMYKVSQSVTAIKALAEQHSLRITIRSINCHMVKYGPEDGFPVSLGIIDDHIFANKPTSCSLSALKNPEYYNHQLWPSIMLKSNQNGRKVISAKPSQLLNSFQVIKYLYERKESLLNPIHMDMLNESLKNISFLESKCLPSVVTTKEIEYKQRRPNKYEHIVYADLETLVINKNHTAYLAAWKIDNQETQHSYGLEYCVEDMLDAIPDKSVVWFHNLGFDIRFISKYLSFSWQSKVIQNGTKTKQCDGFYKGKTLTFKDSYSFVSSPLSAMPKMFGIEEMSKESFPHDIMSKNNYLKPIKWSDLEVYEKDHPELRANANAIGAIIMYRNNECLDTVKYATHYCIRDVDCLHACFTAFRKMFIAEFEQDPFDFVSLPGLAEATLADRDCFEGCHNLSGETLSFVRQAIVGGRVMCRANEKQWVKNKVIADADVNSLYPSAFAELPGFPIGAPIITKADPTTVPFDDSCIKEYDMDEHFKQGTYYISRIRITKVGKHLNFPLLSITGSEGVRNFTNDLEGCEMVLDQYAIEDFKQFQEAEIEIIESLVWDKGFNTRIVSTIIDMYETRNKYKKAGNPIEQVIKLVLNSSYGKLIQKPITTELKMVSVSKTIRCNDCKNNGCNDCYRFTVKDKQCVKACDNCIKLTCSKCRKGKTIADFTRSNIKRLVSRTDFAYDEQGKVTHALFELHRNVIQHESPAHLGVMTLSMSKRIMNRAMCLSEDLGQNIYYQDTDSMHIPADELEVLADAYRSKYGVEMMGKNLGQFSSDFNLKGSKGEVVATESIFLGKKCYIDRLEATDGSTGWHARMKGIPSKKLLEGDIYQTYVDLYNCKPIEIECSKYCPLEIDARTQEVKKRSSFKRTLFFPDTIEQREAYETSLKLKSGSSARPHSGVAA